MNAAEFNTELGKLMDRAMKEGVMERKMGPIEIVGIIELQKNDLVRTFQDLARSAALAEPRLYLPRRGNPPA